MGSPPRGNHYDPGLGVCQVEIRSESVQGAAPEAEEGHVEEGDPSLMDQMNHEGGINHEGHGNHEGGSGDQEPWQQQAEMAHVATTEAP